MMNEMNGATRMQYMRSGIRVNSRAKLVVEWTEGGQTHRVEGYTMDIGPKGCLAVVPQGFAVGQKLRLINSINGKAADATLIWRGHEGRTGWELGLELENPETDFWGVEL
jgi:hypothetical protein